ncbi:MAG: hypothetical protein RLY58_1221 [Pseudomonadota bacterium]|jgi:hypothetical protein
MNSTAMWVIALIVLFVLGSLLGLRISPREKALGELRDRARKMGLHPRLVPAPAWTGHKASNGNAGGMMAYYHMVLPAARLSLLQATVVDGVLHVLLGDPRLNGHTVAIAGAQALDMQANSIGLYWDEAADLHGTALETMKTTLTSLAQQMQP